MPRCVFLSMDSLEGYTCDDYLAEAALRNSGWEVQTLSWRQPHNWELFDVVVVRSTWDYQEAPHLFVQCLTQIDQSRAMLQNPLPLLQWNMDKHYLRDLAKWGIPIVPTLWNPAIDPHLFSQLNTDEIVVKPTISASAQDTYRLGRSTFRIQQDLLLPIFANRGYMVQPFRHSIVSEGEYSLFYFGAQYSHAILKRPQSHDFRVQEEHGGQIGLVEAPTGLRTLSKRILEHLPLLPLYARLDYVRGPKGGWECMELELIEPSMYLRFAPQSPALFAEKISNHSKERDSFN